MKKTDQSMVAIESHICESQVITLALSILNKRITGKDVLTCPIDVKNYLSLKFGSATHEIFSCIYLDNKNQIIAFEELFRGTIDQVSVYPREVVLRCLENNSSALVVAHNHPSGICEPSEADKSITKRLKKALEIVDIRLLDHMIVGGSNCISFAERGYL